MEEKSLTLEETEAQRKHERVNRAMWGLGKKTRRATIHDVRDAKAAIPGVRAFQAQVLIDQPLRRVSPLTRKQARHLLWARKERGL